MVKCVFTLGLLLIGLVTAPFGNAERLRVLGPIAENAVLQRDAPITLKGIAPAHSNLEIRFADQSHATTASKDGKWQVELLPLASGGPYKLSVSSSTDMIEFSGILIGDIWLCAGQSNMEYPVYRALNPDTMIAGPHSDQIRMYAVPHQTSVTAEERFQIVPEWQLPSAETVGSFSAVCYFSAQNVHQQENVPIGLIDASWGGSQIEAWLSPATLNALGSFETELDLLKTYRTDPTEAMRRYGKTWEGWWQTQTGTAPWQRADSTKGWKNAPSIMQDWNTYDDPALVGYTGRIWFTRKFSLTEEEARQDAMLSLGIVDELDLTWINGHFVGTMESWSDGRIYPVSQAQLKPGSNEIMVLAQNGYGAGGMLGPNQDIHITLEDGEKISLDQDWKYVPAADVGPSPSPAWVATSGFSTIHNAMVAPFGDWSFSKAIWYQGESNTGRGEEYQPLLSALIDQWRTSFGEDLVVAIIQLPGYGRMPTTARPSGWSDVREAQRQVSLKDDQVGLIVTIDAGDRTDIHPPNKQIIAERVASLFLEPGKFREGLQDGFNPVSVRHEGTDIIVTMPSDDLRTISGPRPIGFQICEGNNQCAWADARIENNRIHLEARQFAEPKMVRYCWGDAPVCNLFHDDDIPVVPFQELIDR